MKSSIESVHKQICEHAALIANEDQRKPYELRNAKHLFFERASKTKLSIDYDDALLPHKEPDRSDAKRVLHRIGRDALAESIRQNAELFMGMVIGYGRQTGEDYFDRFK